MKYLLLLFVLSSCVAHKSVRMECLNSIFPQNDTLWVVDGRLTTKNPFPFMLPLTVKTIDTLKGNEAALIYGTRAANGAYLITTNFRELHKEGWFMGTTCSPTYVTKKKK
jgi:hypothetical protein